MVTVALALAADPLTAPTEQAPLATIVGVVLALVVAVTRNVLPKTAGLVGAPLKLAVGVFSPAAADCMSEVPL